MIYILDTDVLNLLGHEDSPEAPRVRRRIAELPSDDLVVTTIITYEEQMRGWMAALARAKSMTAEVATYDRLLRHLETYRRIPVLSYDRPCANLVAQLRPTVRRMGSMDLKIAAITLAHDATLVTRNLADFRGLPRLRVEDWTDR